MGSGDRVQITNIGGISFGFCISRFPFLVTISVFFLFWAVTIGIGKGYDHA